MNKLSFIVASFKRLPFIRRTLYNLNKQNIKIPFEVVIGEEITAETPLLLEELRKYSFPWTVVMCDAAKYEAKFGVKKYWNNPSWTYNCALRNVTGTLSCVLGNDI